MDPRAERFTRLVVLMRADVSRYVARRLRPDEVDDVLADIWLVLWRRFDVVPTDPGAARRWLFAVAGNTVRGARRSGARRRRLSSHLERAGAPVVSPTDEERLALVTAWTGLRPEERQVLEVAVRVGAGKATADALGLSEDAASARLHRARRRMLSLLER